MGWKTIGGSGQGTLQKWDREGMELQGNFRNTWEGQHGPLGAIDDAHGEVVIFPVHTALVGKLEGVKQGQLVRIKFLGTVKSAAGRDYKDFAVDAWTDEDEGPQLPLEEGPGDAEEDAPF